MYPHPGRAPDLASPALGPAASAMTVVVPTINSAGWIRHILAYYRAVDLQPVFFVDTRSTDDCLAVLRGFGAHVEQVTGPEPRVEALLPAISDCTTTAWLLRVDDDEVPSRNLVGWLRSFDPRSSKDVVGFARRWLRFVTETRLRYLASRKWDWRRSVDGEDRQFRLFRKDGVTFETGIHSPGIIADDADLAPPECCLFHFDWVLRSKPERLEKMRRYELQSEGAGSQFGKYYLPEDVGVWDFEQDVDDPRVQRLAARLRRACAARARRSGFA